jgi:alcohol dehydrogenase (NADP+)
MRDVPLSPPPRDPRRVHYDRGMRTLQLRGGARMPALGLGTWKSAPGEVGRAVREALRVGYRHIDCAAIYGNESEVGEALGDALDAGEVTRDELWVTSKLWCNAHAPADVEPALQRTLADLRLERLDLYLVHWPVAVRRGLVVARTAADFVPPSELSDHDTWSGMEAVLAQGLTRTIGVSNFGPRRLAELARHARVQPDVDQVELHPYLQQRELLAHCRSAGIAVTGYSPLGSLDRPAGMRAADEPVLLEDPVVCQVAGRHGASPAQVLIAWQLQQGLSVIPKSVRPERLRENFEAQHLELDADDLGELATLDAGRRLRRWPLLGAARGPVHTRRPLGLTEPGIRCQARSPGFGLTRARGCAAALGDGPARPAGRARPPARSAGNAAPRPGARATRPGARGAGALGAGGGSRCSTAR